MEIATDDSLTWFGRSWGTNLDIGSRLYFPGEPTRWKAWVSLRFHGETYGGQDQPAQMLCDRVILVRSP